MKGFFKLYMIGVLICAPGVAHSQETKTLEAKPELAAVIVQVPPLNNYKTCLFAIKKKMASCKTDLNLSLKNNVDSAHTIFKKQRRCELNKEQNLSRCKKIFLRK